jgi:crossover junction endodeoxyribonuclease RuvC
MIVLGIDPGMAETGYGVIAVEGGRMRALGHGVVATDARSPAAARLALIHAQIAELVDRHAPATAALEDLFVGANPRTILSVGQARGAILAALGAAGVDAAGYPPAEVKKAVCGFGRADKGQMTRMVTAILGLEAPPGTDHAADALAVAVCHATRARSRAPLAVAR